MYGAAKVVSINRQGNLVSAVLKYLRVPESKKPFIGLFVFVTIYILMVA